MDNQIISSMANGHGGKRPNSGRKSKIDEIKLIERLTPMADDAYKALHEGIKSGSVHFVKLFFEYYVGKPKQMIEAEIKTDELSKTVLEFIKTKEE